MAIPIIAIAMGLAQAVPSIVGLFKGKKAADNAQAVVDIAQKITGCNDPEKAVDMVVNDPKLTVELKSLMLNSILEEERLHLQDVQDARQADVEKVKATGRRDWAMYTLAGVIVIGFFALTYALMTRPLPAGSSDAVLLLFGGLNMAFGSVVGYFFGSSKSSSDKTDLMAEMKK